MTLPAAHTLGQKMDWIGVIALIVAVSCLQLVLDRGERLGWLSSSEVIINSVLSATAFYIFVVHCLTTDAPYVTLKMLMDRNYVIGLFLIFTFGVAVFSSLFILPLFLQNIQGYPVLSAGWVISSRGVGTMFAMMCSGFLLSIISGKYLILLGLICVGVSNVWMTQWTADVNMQEVIYITIINGFGMGMMWVALTTVTFSTLDPVYRVEAASLFSLIRAIGASMGTSIVVSILVRSTQANYIEMREQITEFKSSLGSMLNGHSFDLKSITDLRNLESVVMIEAQMVGFLNDFVFLVIIAFGAIPFVFLLRGKKPKTD